MLPKPPGGSTKQLSRETWKPRSNWDLYAMGRMILKRFDGSRQAAEKGRLEAQVQLGHMFESGQGVSQDAAEAARWYRMAGEQGNVSAQRSLGSMYKSGRGVSQDVAEAIRWYRMAADQGDALAELEIRCAEHMTKLKRVSQRLKKEIFKAKDEKVRLFNEMAFHDAVRDAEQVTKEAFTEDPSVPQDDTEVFRRLRQAAENGNPIGQVKLGLMYSLGRGVTQNDVEAVQWYRLAADQGNLSAQGILGSLYAGGRGVQQDDVEAVRWYRKAADQGCTSAQYNLGRMYSDGRGVSQDDSEAVRWYRKAAEQGNAQAQARLGFSYAQNWAFFFLGLPIGTCGASENAVSVVLAKTIHRPLQERRLK